MRWIRFMIKIAVFPVLILVGLLKWIWVFLSGFAQIPFYLIAGICLLTAIGGFAFGLEDGTVTIRLLVTGFTFFMIPVTATMLLVVLMMVQEALIDFIFS